MEINQLLKNIKNNLESDKNDELIEYLYNNTELILEIINNYLDKLKNNDINTLDLYLTSKSNINELEIKIKNENMIFKFCTIYQYIVSYLFTKYSHSTLLENEEIINPKSNIKYELIISDNEIKIKLFCLVVILHYLESNIRVIKYDITLNKNKPYVGLDYEFNNRIISLMQINFERLSSSSSETVSHLCIVNPGEFDDKSLDILIKYLMRNKCLYKILHGCDSLDLPYMYDVLFRGQKDVIMDFTETIIDTRFLCEYYRASIDEEKNVQYMRHFYILIQLIM